MAKKPSHVHRCMGSAVTSIFSLNTQEDRASHPPETEIKFKIKKGTINLYFLSYLKKKLFPFSNS